MASMSDATRDAIIDAIRGGRKIEAIKLYREATREGLKEAKDFIEALQEQLHEENPTEFPAAKPGCGAAILFAILALSAAAALA